MAGEGKQATEGAKTHEDYVGEILSDPELKPSDYNRALNDSDYLQGLVDKRREADTQNPTGGDKGGGEGTGGAQDPGAQGGEKKGGDKPKPKKRGQGYKRSAEVYRQRLDKTEEENRQLREQLAEARKGGGGAQDPGAQGGEGPQALPTGQQQQEEELVEPKEDNFDSLSEYEEAMIEYRVQKGIRAELSKRDEKNQELQNQQQQQQRVEKMETDLKSQVAAAKEAHEDYDDVIGQAAHVEFDPWQVECFALSGNFGELAYRLGKDPERAEALKDITHPILFNQALGKIQAEIGSTAPAGGESQNGAGKGKRAAAAAGDKGGGSGAQQPAKKKELPPPVGGTVIPGGAPVVKDEEYYLTQASPAEFQAWRAGKVS